MLRDLLASVFGSRPADTQPTEATVRGWNKVHRLDTLLQASYEAASRRDDLWTEADFRDADATLLPEKRRRLRSHSRWEAANNPQIARILKIWVEDVCGPEGPWLSLGTGQAAIDSLIEERWSTWWRVTRQAAKLTTAVRAEAVDGEALGIRVAKPRNRMRAKISTDVTLLECDRLASPDWSNNNSSHNVDGVHLDPVTRDPVAYEILKAHPGTEYIDQATEMFESVMFPADQVLHVYRQLRPEQHRGLPRSTPALMLAGMLRKYLNGQIDKAQLQSAVAFAIKSMAPPETEEAGGDDSLWQTVRLPNRQGLGIMFPDGYEPIQFKTDGDAQDIETFMRVLCALYGGCFAMPLGLALGQYSATNYAGVRGDMLPYHQVIAADRVQLWESLWLEPLFEDFLTELIATDEFQLLLAKLTLEERAVLNLHATEWHWEGEKLVVDPSREETAREKKLRMGLATREDEFQGQDLDKHDARSALQLGIVDAAGKPDVVRYRQIVCKSLHGVDPGEEAESEGSGDGERGAGRPHDLNAEWMAANERLFGMRPGRLAAALQNVTDRLSDLEANCGTGKGGFQGGNSCARGRGGGSGRAKLSRTAKVLVGLVGAAVFRQVVLKRLTPIIIRGILDLLVSDLNRVQASLSAERQGNQGDRLLHEMTALVGEARLARRIVRAYRGQRRRRTHKTEQEGTEDTEAEGGQGGRLEANCGTGKGGFQAGNSCAKVGGAGTGARDAILLRSRRFKTVVDGLNDGTLTAMETGETIRRSKRLSIIEQAALVSYTDRQVAAKLNRLLRGGATKLGATTQASQSALAEAIEAGLKKLPRHAGSSYRGLPSKFVSHLKVGGTYRDGGFMSTTPDRKNNRLKGGPGQAIIKIEGRNGRSIFNTSHFPSEKEVLFTRGTTFKVTRRRQAANGTLFLSLREES